MCLLTFMSMVLYVRTQAFNAIFLYCSRWYGSYKILIFRIGFPSWTHVLSPPHTHTPTNPTLPPSSPVLVLVQPEVLFQVGLACKVFVAVFTLEGSDATVGDNVSLQLVWTVELLITA